MIPDENMEFAQNITNLFNDSIVFNSDELRMAYTIRDPIINRKSFNSILKNDSIKI